MGVVDSNLYYNTYVIFNFCHFLIHALNMLKYNVCISMETLFKIFLWILSYYIIINACRTGMVSIHYFYNPSLIRTWMFTSSRLDYLSSGPSCPATVVEKCCGLRLGDILPVHRSVLSVHVQGGHLAKRGFIHTCLHQQHVPLSNLKGHTIFVYGMNFALL